MTPLIACDRGLSAADEERITDLAAQAKALFARDEEIKAQRKALDEEINNILEKERRAADREAQQMASLSPQSEEQKKRPPRPVFDGRRRARKCRNA